MHTIMDEISNNIALYRKLKKLTQKELALRLGLSHTTVSSWETGTSSIDIDTLYKVCLILDVTLGDMYGKYMDVDKEFSREEKKLVYAYRSHPEMQAAVNVLLKIDDAKN